MLSVRGLGVAFAGCAVFSAWSADVDRGVTWVVGDDGCGKTTLLRWLAGALDGDGTVALDGVAFGAAAERPVAWCDTRDDALDALAAGALFDRLRASPHGVDAAALARHVAGFDLAPHLGKAMFQLSTGTRRKVGLAGVLAMRAPVLLLDDPTAALDGASVAHLRAALAEIDRAALRTALVTGHAVPAGAPPARRLVLPPRR